MNDQNRSEYESNKALPKGTVELNSLLTEHLDEQADNLNYNITSRLRAGRYRALACEQPRKRSIGISRLTLAGGACAAMLTLLVVMQIFTNPNDVPVPQVALVDSQGSPSAPAMQTQIVEDLKILSATDDIEFYESLEFLEWMETNSG